MNTQITIGRIVAAHGLEGAVIVKHVLGGGIDFKKIEFVFIETQKNNFVPYHIMSCKTYGSEELLLQLDGLTTREAAQLLRTKKLNILEKDFVAIADQSTPMKLLGYTVVAQQKKIGTISAITEQQHQALLTVFVNNKEVLLPLHKNNVEKIDTANKEIHLLLPDGLIEIYLE